MRWMLQVAAFKAGVQQIAFDPSNTNLIFGVATDVIHEYSVSLFYIDNSHPFLTDTVIFLHYNMGKQLEQIYVLSMHMMTSIRPGQIHYLTSTDAVFAWPLDAQTKIWSLKSKDEKFLNLASDFSASRGTYVAAYDATA